MRKVIVGLFLVWALAAAGPNWTYTDQKEPEAQPAIWSQAEMARFLEAWKDLKAAQAAGDYARADAIYRSWPIQKMLHYLAGLQDIRPWLIIGPFDNTENKSFERVFGPEADVLATGSADAQKEYQEVKGQKIKWQTALTWPKAGNVYQLDFDSLFDPNEWVVAYAFTFVKSPQAQATKLLLGSDDGIKVWINGKVVHSNNILRGMSPAQDTVQVNLNAGWNSLLVKITEAVGGWGFYFDIADLKGKPLPDLVFGTKKSE